MKNTSLTSMLFVLFILLISSVSAVSPFRTTATSGCEIAPVIRETIKLNQDFDFNFHVTNTSNGVPLSNTTLSCVFHLYNQTGDHVLGLRLPNDPYSEHLTMNEWAARISGGNFSSRGIYAYWIGCNGTGIGCAEKSGFEVTDSGMPNPDGFNVAFFSLIFIILLASLTYSVVVSVGHAVTLDYDIKDLAISYGLYFSLIGASELGKVFFMNSFYDFFFSWAIPIGIFTHIILPTVYFILTLTMGTWMEQRVKGVDM